MKNIKIQTQQHEHQTRFQEIKGKVLFAIKHKSRIKGLIASIIIKST